jgi:hypothetical protein
MDVLAEHIIASAGKDGGRLMTLITACRAGRTASRSQAAELHLAAAPDQALRAALQVLRRQEFTVPGGIDRATGQVCGYYQRDYQRHEPPLSAVPALPADQVRLRFDVEVRAQQDGGGSRLCVLTSAALPTWVDAFTAAVTRTATGGTARRVRHDPVLPPGGTLTGPWTGRLLDYSGCATLDEAADLVKAPGDEKVLPLGFYAFTPPGDDDEAMTDVPEPSPLLCLGRYANGGLMVFNGTLVVAPQNSGKTELIVRWALAANAAGYSVFVVDVKGEMFRRLRAEGLQGRVLYFTTDPEPTEPLGNLQNLNLLDGLDCLTAPGRRRIEQLVEAMLPITEVKDEEGREYWEMRARWITAMVNLLLLSDDFTGDCDADLGTLYRLASNENELLDLMTVVETGFASGDVDPPDPPVEYWRNELSQLLGPDNGGARDARYTYQYLTSSITTLLRPFSQAGVLRSRTSGTSDFRLEEVNSDAAVTIVLAAREQDGEEAKTVLSMVIKRLEQIFYDRRKLDSPIPVLLLLDETRRIRGFQPAEYITFARDAKAGVVLVYQSLTQIRDPDRRIEILENVGTQIYLRSVTGETAKQLIALLPVRGRPTFSSSETVSDEGGSEALQLGQEAVPYFSTAELYRLPAGEHPALVYIKDHGGGKPMLVDMDRERIRRTLDGLRRPIPESRPPHRML